MLAKGPGGRQAPVTGLELRAGETTGPVVMTLEPTGTLVIMRPAAGVGAGAAGITTGKRRVVVRSAGVPLADHELEPGGVPGSGSVELLLSAG